MTDHAADIAALVPSIWDTLFTEPLAVADGTDLGGTQVMSGYVTIDGAWQGGVLVEMPVALGRIMTAEILGTDVAPGAEEVLDAMGEFCNIVAGNFKALVAGPSHLSLPLVTVGTDYEVNVMGAARRWTVGFTAHGDTFLVTVHEGGGVE